MRFIYFYSNSVFVSYTDSFAMTTHAERIALRVNLLTSKMQFLKTMYNNVSLLSADPCSNFACSIVLQISLVIEKNFDKPRQRFRKMVLLHFDRLALHFF